MLTYDLTKRTNGALYEYLCECIKQDILSGKILAGQKLPSKRALAKHLNISITTIENAYGQLLMEGFVCSEPGSGYYVMERSPSHQLWVKREVQKKNVFTKDAEHIIDFRANRSSCQLFPASIWAKLMRQTLAEQETVLYEMVPYNGLFALRSAIAEYLYRYRGMLVEPDQIIVGAGTEYLYGKLMDLLGHDSIVAFGEPGYKKIAQVATTIGCLADFIPIDESGIVVEKLEKSKANILHVSPANHFPVGTVTSMDRRKALVKWVNAKADRYIIEDDYDCELRYHGNMMPTLYTMDDREKVIYINTFSKSLVPSIRISYMVLPLRIIDMFEASMSFYSCTVSSFEQFTLAEFISEGYFEKHLNRMENYYRKLRQQFMEEIARSPLHKITEIYEKNAGTHFLLHVSTKLSDEEIKICAENHHIHLSVLSDYTSKKTVKNKGILVINYASIQPENISKAVDVLCSIFQSDL